MKKIALINKVPIDMEDIVFKDEIMLENLFNTTVGHVEK